MGPTHTLSPSRRKWSPKITATPKTASHLRKLARRHVMSH